MTSAGYMARKTKSPVTSWRRRDGMDFHKRKCSDTIEEFDRSPSILNPPPAIPGRVESGRA